MNKYIVFRFTALFLVLLTTACGTRQLQHKAGPEATAWQGYVARATAAEINTGPFRVSANLRYTSKEQSTRVSSFLWGNGSLESPYPLRLDLIAGVGNIVAKIREDNEQFMAYTPDQNLVLYHPKDSRTLVSFGVPIPLTLSDLVLLITGRAGALVLPPKTTTATPAPTDTVPTENGFLYPVANSRLGGFIEINKIGNLVSWRQHQTSGWIITFDASDDNPLQPKRLKVNHPNGYQAIIVIKDIERMPAPYPKEQLDLAMPEGVEFRQLEE